MKFLSLFNDLSESFQVMAALSLLGYMWIRSHFNIKNKVNDLANKFDDFDEYANSKFGKILERLNKDNYKDSENNKKIEE